MTDAEKREIVAAVLRELAGAFSDAFSGDSLGTHDFFAPVMARLRKRADELEKS